MARRNCLASLEVVLGMMPLFVQEACSQTVVLEVQGFIKSDKHIV